MIKPKLIFPLIIMVLFFEIAQAAPLPAESTNPYYIPLFRDWLNGTIDTRESGKLIIGLNASFYDFNITGTFIANTGNFTYLNVSQDLITMGKVGIGTSTPINALTIIGDVSAFGSLNATFINATEVRQGLNQVQTINAIFNIVNYSIEYAATGFKIANFTTAYDARTDRFGIANGTTLPFSRFILANLSRIGNVDINTSGSLNVSQNITFTSLKSCDTINTDSNGLLTCGSDATGSGFTQGGSLSALNVNVTGIFNSSLESYLNYATASQCLQLDANRKIVSSGGTCSGTGEDSTKYYQLVNFTVNYDARTDRWLIVNTSNYLSSNGYIRGSDFNVKNNISNTTQDPKAIYNNSPVNITDLRVQTINGTDLALFNKSIDLSLYNKSVSLINYNQSVSLDGYNKSINLITIMQDQVSNFFNSLFNGLNFTNSFNSRINNSDMNLTKLSVRESPGPCASGTYMTYTNMTTSICVDANESISLDGYNKSISLVNYNQSISLVNYNQSLSLDNYYTQSVIFTHIENNKTSANTSLNKYGWIKNNTDASFSGVNISGGVGTSNLTLFSNFTFFTNGSHLCLNRCK